MIDQAKWMGERLGMGFVFQRNLSFGTGGFGNAVLTKFEIVASRSHRLTSKGEQRGLLEVHVRTPDGPLTVFCTHLGLDPDERSMQAREIAVALDSSTGVKLVCGDFNEDVDGPAVTALIGLSGVVDAGSNCPPTFSSNRPASRIDLILCDPSIGVHSVSVPKTTASDHLPVVADLMLPKASSPDLPPDARDRLAEH